MNLTLMDDDNYPTLSVKQFKERYGTKTASLILKQAAEDAKPAMKELLLELATNLEAMLSCHVDI